MDYIKEYLMLNNQLENIEDEMVIEQLEEKMNKIWYYYLTPRDIQLIKQQLGRRNEK